MSLAILGLACLFFLGHGLKWFFLKTKIPDLLILVIIGYLVGPVFGIIDQADLGKSGSLLSTLALVVILYEGGLELNAKDLLTSSLPASGLALLGFLCVSAFSAAFAYLFAFQLISTSILFGLALGCVSAAVVIPMVKQLSISKQLKTTLTLESAFTDVVTIVIFLVIVESVAAGSIDVNKLLYGIGPKTLLAVIFGASSGLIWAWLKKNFTAISNMTFAGEAWALLTYGLLELPHYNGVLGVFALGFTLANIELLPGWLRSSFDHTPISHDEINLLSEITFILKTFFFIYLGMLIQFNDLQTILFATSISLVIIISRFFIVKLVLSPKNTTNVEAIIATAMGPRGLATAVLATIPLQRGITGGEWIQSTLFAVIPITILLTAIMVFIAESENLSRYFFRLFSKYPDKLAVAEEVEQTSLEPQ